MQEAPTISRSRPALQSADYALLREQGIAQVQQLAAKIWTDHNVHDPGITILEALCYAITEIGHRIQQPVVDILHSHPGGAVDWDNLFFSADKILPNCPLTVKDYRKLLIDIPAVRNAYFLKADRFKLPFFAQYREVFPFPPAPEYITYPHTPYSSAHSARLMKPDGLYTVQLELERANINGTFLDLNDRYIVQDVIINGEAYTLGFSFPYWDEIAAFEEWGSPNWNMIGLDITSSINIPDGPSDPENYYDYYATLRVTLFNPFHNPTTIQLQDFTVKIKVLTGPGSFNKNIFFISHLDVPLFSGSIPLHNGMHLFFERFKAKMERTAAAVEAVRKRLMANRNLCEDFQKFMGIRTQEIELCGNIELLPGADPNEVFVQIFLEIGRFFSPSIPFFSLEELLEEGLLLEQIFEGPKLDNGFIKDQDLEAIQRENAVYTSDLINIIMDVEGVLAVHNFRISSYLDNQLAVGKEANCIQSPANLVLRPRLDARRTLSSLQARFDGYVQELDVDFILEKYLEGMQPVGNFPGVDAIPFPQGNSRPLEAYHSIQNDFPLTYGVGVEGLPPSAPQLRKAQTQQMKAYLLFFDQFLANFLSQLVRLQDYFSMAKQINRTYFYQPLYAVPKVQELFKSFTDGSSTWDVFTADANNGYQVLLKQASENEPTFWDRRNRFLDHVLSRFAEDFTDYSLLLFEQMAKLPVLDRQLINLEDVVVQPGEQICLPITVSGPVSINALKFSIVYDPRVLEYDFAGAFNINLAGLNVSSLVFPAEPGTIGLDWSGATANLIDGEVLLELCFNSLVPTNTIVRFGDNPVPKEFVNGSNVNDLFSGKYSRITQDKRLWGYPRLLDDKIDYLQYLPQISSGRAKAYNYSQRTKTIALNGWGRRISEYELRIHKRLGFKVSKRRDLHWNLLESDYFVEGTVVDAGHPKRSFTLNRKDGTSLLQGEPGILDIYTREEILDFAKDKTNYELNTSIPWGFKLWDKEGLLLATNAQTYANQALANTGILTTASYIFDHHTSEGFHLLEHILLRPQHDDGITRDRLLPVMDYQNLRVLPYSFVLLIIFPSGLKRNIAAHSETCEDNPANCTPLPGARRLRDKKFRRFAERVIREELPAHIFPHIRWLDVDTNASPADTSLNHFETVFKSWLHIFGVSAPDVVSPAQRDLVDAVEKCLPQPNL